jgi:L-threonylcarbamoyladenylate synthase
LETLILPAAEEASLSAALDLIHTGQLVAFPTDTVYGLGAALESPESIEQLYLVKDREASKAIAVLVGDPSDAVRAASSLKGIAERLASRFWPGPLTLVVSRRLDLPENLSPQATIGIRMPDHPLALRLLQSTGPLAVTSANLSGSANTTSAREVYDQLAGRIPLILDGGRTPGGQPSTVVDCTTEEPVILRPGPISIEQLLDALS